LERGRQAQKEGRWHTASIFYTRAIRAAIRESREPAQAASSVAVADESQQNSAPFTVTPLLCMCWMARSRAYKEQDNVLLALRDLDMLLMLDPPQENHVNWQVFWARIRLLGELGHYKEALVALRDIRISTRDPINIAFWIREEKYLVEQYEEQLKHPDELESLDWYVTVHDNFYLALELDEEEEASAPEGSEAPSDPAGDSVPSDPEREGSNTARVHVRPGAVHNRGLFTDRAFNKGDCIFVESPLAIGLIGDSNLKHCQQCSRLVDNESMQRCECTRVVFCSDQCKQKCKSHHLWQCNAIKKSDSLATESNSTPLTSVNNSASSSSIPSGVDAPSSGSEGADAPSSLMLQLLGRYSRESNVLEQCQALVALPWPAPQVREYSEGWHAYCTFLADANVSPEWFDYYTFDVVRGIIEHNGFALCHGKEPAYGVALYVKGSFLNHSCRPNTRFSVDEAGRLCVYALTDIAADTELTFHYAGEDAIDSAEFDASMLPFHCVCAHCVATRTNASAAAAHTESSSSAASAANGSDA
jgi:hypothetical protein